MIVLAVASPPTGVAGDPVGELRRQAVLVADLARRLESVLRELPRDDMTSAWRGAARDAVQHVVDIERARLAREIDRLEGVRIQLDHAAEQAISVSYPLGVP